MYCATFVFNFSVPGNVFIFLFYSKLYRVRNRNNVRLKIPKIPFGLALIFSFCFYLDNGSEASPENVSINFMDRFSVEATLPFSFLSPFSMEACV